MTMKCLWCLASDHIAQQCPHVGIAITHTPPVYEPRSDADDALDALQHRFLMTRTFAGQLLREMREAGLAPTPATLALNPDPE